MIGPVRAAYDQLIAAHELKPDPAQARAVVALDRLANALLEKETLSRDEIIALLKDVEMESHASETVGTIRALPASESSVDQLR